LVTADKTISQLALELAVWAVEQGIREHGGNNRGDWPDHYADELGLDPARALPWCTTGLGSCFREAARQLGVACPFPRTAKAVQVWNASDAVGRDSNPAPGRVYILDHGRTWAQGLVDGRLLDNGHVGIVRDVDANGMVTEISANT